MLHKGTLFDLVDHRDEDKRRGLNVLDLPMGGTPIPTPPQYGFVSSLIICSFVTHTPLVTLPPTKKPGEELGTCLR